MEYTQRAWIIRFSLNFLTAERRLILGTAKINQHICFKGFLTSEFESKDMLFGKQVLLLFPQKMRTCGFIPG